MPCNGGPYKWTRTQCKGLSCPVTHECRNLFRKHHQTKHVQMTFEDKNNQFVDALIRTRPTPSFPSFLPSFFFACFATLTTSLGDDWSHRLHRRSPSWGFPRFSFVVKQISGNLYRAPGIILLSPLPLADRRDWCDTRGNWSLPRNPVKSWWHRHITLMLFGCRSWLHGQEV